MKRFTSILITAVMLFIIAACPVSAANTTKSTAQKFRRPLSNESPMLIVHIDTWNEADPQKIIDLIPDDIRPYVVFNISLSIGTDDKGEFMRSGSGGGYETAKSWLKTCAENQVWAMVQPASGGKSNFPDYGKNDNLENTLYGEFFRDYPNFLGFNYCEQFWGFGENGAPTLEKRYEHLGKLLELSNKYGGYVVVSWCGNQWGQWCSPLAQLKTHDYFSSQLKKYANNFILCDKYTQSSYKHDVQSQVLGFYLSGYCGNFGVRYDETAWSDKVDGKYTQSTGLSIMLESMLMSGATVIDGPELIWKDDFNEVGATRTSDGFTSRKWIATDMYQNVALDMFRKVIDGSVRIPTREEVIARTKIAIIQNQTTGNDDSKYCTPESLTDGLYRLKGDGGLRNNYYHYKSTGRYPTIPVIYKFNDTKLEKAFSTLVKYTDYRNRWSTTKAKTDEFNKLFPQEYTGDMYASRLENTWWTYSYYLKGETAKATLNLKYNTCDTLGLSYSNYSSGIITEYSDHIDFWLDNYDHNSAKTLKKDVITIKGATEKPSYKLSARTNCQVTPKATESWSNGVYTLTVQHNGPVDLTINCKGNAKNRETEYTKAKIVEPKLPAVYTGVRQYEAECFDVKNTERTVKNGYGSGISGYTGQGYLIFGTKNGAAIKDTVTVNKDGSYTLKFRYRAASRVSGLELYINGKKTSTLAFPQADSWKLGKVTVKLNAGENTIELRATKTLAAKFYLDNMTIQ